MKFNEKLALSLYEISDLHINFSMRSLESYLMPRDYGTGALCTALEAHTVTLIEQNPGITVTEIANRFKRSKSSISQLTTRLVNKGLIVKAKADASNKAVRNLFVTDSGRKLSLSHVEYDENQISSLMEKLNEYFSLEDLNTVFRYMQLMVSKTFFPASLG